MKILVLNGPNLNMLGRRESEHYGSLTLDHINERLAGVAGELGLELEFAQSNSEGELVSALQRAGESCAGVALNAAAYTHTSVALRDAVLCCGVPVVEVHLSNPAAREGFRHVSYLAGAVAGSIAGFGWRSYALALRWLAEKCAS
ncbi:MAG: type II 3-dehydroquinate dehydratase [Desulfarculaceae bacterium]|nr:type II 3-dehydroquinate dehydratase [Desulfarculaceae bacterium]MCF8071658.1 type II 3-dehydroquinate dehydratase [Desulfarculaceae bacterium]MCF8102495.1 type II 3-dehydroquinate dehydratase [Desulfarculaceae bacterium]MCF8114937.1 type II 3-dehydroquinate dehydratase [Desulfarculaceae bacterium]